MKYSCNIGVILWSLGLSRHCVVTCDLNIAPCHALSLVNTSHVTSILASDWSAARSLLWEHVITSLYANNPQWLTPTPIQTDEENLVLKIFVFPCDHKHKLRAVV